MLELNKKVKYYDLNYTSDSREFEEEYNYQEDGGFPPVHSHTRTDLALPLLTIQEHTTHMAMGLTNSTQKLLQKDSSCQVRDGESASANRHRGKLIVFRS